MQDQLCEIVLQEVPHSAPPSTGGARDITDTPSDGGGAGGAGTGTDVAAADMQAYQNAQSGFGMQNAASSFYAAAQSSSPYGVLHQSYPGVTDGKL